MTFGVLGPLRVWDGDGRAIDGLRPAHRRLLAILLVDAGWNVPADRLIDRFWAGEPPATAKAALQTHVSAMRRVLPQDLIVTATDGYAVRLDGIDVDVEAVAAAVGRCDAQMEQGRFADAIATASEALARWRGRAWAELDDDDFARAEIARAEELRLGLLERRAEAQLAAGQHAAALADLEGLVDEHPLRERLWEHLIVARQRLGRHADAVRAFRAVEETLADIGLEPGERLRALEHRVLAHDPALLHPRSVTLEATHGFPVHHTSFVGRRDDLARLGELLEQRRLVTLTGVGGGGKTRLAVEVARRRWDRGDGEAFFVDLAPLADPELVPAAVAGALGLHRESGRTSGLGTSVASLVQALAGRGCLLVLDNCEHLLEACATLAEQLLQTCGDLRVLATSREPLALEGEHLHRVLSLSLPDLDAPVGEVVESDAVTLFLDRARAVRADLDPDAGDRAAIAQICRRLDGIPLAIEFAAARTAHLTPQGIAERLDDRFRLLTGGRRRVLRQQTLEATLDWSHELLEPAERIVLRRLAAFAGSFGLDVAEAVCSDDTVPPTALLDVLSALVDRSLVVVERPSGEPRYRLLETVRAYAAAKLQEAGEAEGIRSAHRDAYLAWLESEPWGAGYFDPDLLERIIEELSNLRGALEWSWAEGRADLVRRLSSRLHILWQPGIGHGEEGRRWLERSLEGLDGAPADERAACWTALAEASMTLMDPVQEDHSRRAIETGEPLDGFAIHARGIHAMAVATRSMATADAEAAASARSCAQECVGTAPEFGEGWMMHALLYRGEVSVILGDLASAERSYTAAAARSRPAFHHHHVLAAELATCRLLLGDTEGALDVVTAALEQTRSGRPSPWIHLVAALARVEVGERHVAAAHLAEAMTRARATPVFLEMNDCLIHAAAIAHQLGDPSTAGRLLAAATSAGDASRSPTPFRSPAGWAVYRHHVAGVRRDLDADRARRCRDQGRRMSLDEAVRVAETVTERLRR